MGVMYFYAAEEERNYNISLIFFHEAVTRRNCAKSEKIHALQRKMISKSVHVASTVRAPIEKGASLSIIDSRKGPLDRIPGSIATGPVFFIPFKCLLLYTLI